MKTVTIEIKMSDRDYRTVKAWKSILAVSDYFMFISLLRGYSKVKGSVKSITLPEDSSDV